MFFLLHPAGGSVFTMKDLADGLQEKNEKCISIDLPGHGELMGEDCFYEFDTAVMYISRRIKNELNGKKETFSIIGHSMGGLLAYAVAHRLERNYRFKAKNIFVLASGSPDLNAGSFIKDPKTISDDELIRKVSELGGLTKQVLESKNLLELLCPILRADFILLHSYFPRKTDNNRISSNIISMIGGNDRCIKSENVTKWREYTSGEYENVIFEGEHFFYQNNLGGVCDIIMQKENNK